MAAQLCAASDAALERLQSVRFGEDLRMFEQTVATLRDQLPPTTFGAAWAEGRALTLDQAVALALGEPHG